MAQHDSPESKRADVQHAFDCADHGQVIRVCRGNPAVCTKWQCAGMACCAWIVKTRDLTVDDMLARSKPN